MEGDARRISYQALGMGVPVRASGGEVLGTVEHAGGSLHDWFGRTFGRGHWNGTTSQA